MTLTINDTRNNQNGLPSLCEALLWESLEAGHVYTDNNGRYVMGTDYEYVVNLSNGDLIGPTFYDMSYDTFMSCKAKLEIFG